MKKETDHSDFMFTLVAQYDPAQGIIFRWLANHIYFGMDKETANDVFVELKDAAIEIMKERGLVANRDGQFYGLH